MKIYKPEWDETSKRWLIEITNEPETITTYNTLSFDNEADAWEEYYMREEEIEAKNSYIIDEDGDYNPSSFGDVDEYEY